MQNVFEKRPTLRRDNKEITFLAGSVVWCAIFKNIFANTYLRWGSLFSNQFFLLKPKYQASHFSTIKGKKVVKRNYKICI